jgi:hypothetical protein
MKQVAIRAVGLRKYRIIYKQKQTWKATQQFLLPLSEKQGKPIGDEKSD